MIYNLNEITLDIDVKYRSKKAKEKIKEVKDAFKYIPNVKIFKRKSSNGNLHILIIMDSATLEEHFFIRLYFGDDIKRIQNDIKRFDKGLPFNRLWDYKFEQGKYKKAGKWIRIR